MHLGYKQRFVLWLKNNFPMPVQAIEPQPEKFLNKMRKSIRCRIFTTVKVIDL